MGYSNYKSTIGDLRPNVFLFAFEAMKIYIISLFIITTVLFVICLIRFGDIIKVYLILKIAYLLYLIAMAILFIFAMCFGGRLSFVITDVAVVVIFRKIFGGVMELRSIKLFDIIEVEANAYCDTYGSVYLKLKPATADSLQVAPPELDSVCESRRSIWLSAPLTTPPFSGFYGFKQFREFANAIIKARSLASP